MADNILPIKVAAYCRVSTDKDDQLTSLEAQKTFFEEYARINNYNLVELYADEGISGTKLKNRKAFNKMLNDAREGKFQKLFVKDISRFARNAVDFLQSIRELKAMGVKCEFVNSNLSTEDGEFTLGILALVAQEESANLSKRVKFGKYKNAKDGKIPNLVYGYNKNKGQLFTLEINKKEAEVVREIYDMYINKAYGANKIAQILNDRGLKTKRDCRWSQNAVSRILSNPIYTGRVVNGKEEVKDFLTGERIKKDKNDWIIRENKELAIISHNDFIKANKILSSRKQAFNLSGDRQSCRYIFSTLIKCEECGYSFRRIGRNQKCVKWVCSGRNANGKDFCDNHTVIDENQLKEEIHDYLYEIIRNEKGFLKIVADKLISKYKNTRAYESREELEKKLLKLKRLKAKHIEMFEADIISVKELKDRTENITNDIKNIEERIKDNEGSNIEYESYKKAAVELCKDCKSLVNALKLDNRNLRRILEKITVNKEGEIKVYIDFK